MSVREPSVSFREQVERAWGREQYRPLYFLIDTKTLRHFRLGDEPDSDLRTQADGTP